VLIATAGALLGVGFYSWAKFGPALGPDPKDRPLTSVVRRATFTVTVTERGNLESTNTVDGICEVSSREVKIIELVPEGTFVEKGQVVCRFDSSEIDKEIEQQQIKVEQAQNKIKTTEQEVEIARNKGEEDITTANVEHELAVLTLKKYVESDFPSEVFEIQGNIAQQQSKAEETRDKVDQIRELVRKGFRTPEQLRTAELELQQYDFALKANEQKLKGKQDYEYELKSKEYSSKVQQASGKMKRASATAEASVSKAVSEFESAQATYKLEKQTLDERLEMKAKTVITAEQPGVVAYANEYWYDSSRQIREGAMVYFRQKIFSLPDMSSMQVKVNIHESLIKKVKVGQKAEIRIDAFPNLVLVGTVKNVSAIADSTRSWINGGAKEYSTLVTIDAMPEAELKPGMTSEVKILVSTLRGVLVVPVQCVVAHKGKHYVYVEKGARYERREIEIGETNEKLVQVVKGLAEGDRVAQDAQFRADAEFKDEEDEDEKAPKAPAAPSPGVAPPG
jgi:RND family efflux transporter MFP subunit